MSKFLLNATLEFIPDPKRNCCECVFYWCAHPCPGSNISVKFCDETKGYWIIKSIGNLESVNSESLSIKESSKETKYFY